MAVPMWPRPMNPTETGFAEPIPALCEDASPAELERRSYVSFAMSMPLQREINGGFDRHRPIVPGRSVAFASIM